MLLELNNSSTFEPNDERLSQDDVTFARPPRTPFKIDLTWFEVGSTSFTSGSKQFDAEIDKKGRHNNSKFLIQRVVLDSY